MSFASKKIKSRRQAEKVGLINVHFSETGA